MSSLHPSGLAALVALLVSGAACGDSGSGGGGASSTRGADGGAGAGAPGGGGASGEGGASGGGGAAPVASCADVPAEDCFSNVDCPTQTRCENRGTADVPVPCCVPGPRGGGASGEPCAVDDDCATSLCIETQDDGFRCSGACMRDADCPPSLPTCTVVPPFFGQGSYCFPS